MHNLTIENQDSRVGFIEIRNGDFQYQGLTLKKSSKINDIVSPMGGICISNSDAGFHKSRIHCFPCPDQKVVGQISHLNLEFDIPCTAIGFMPKGLK